MLSLRVRPPATTEVGTVSPAPAMTEVVSSSQSGCETMTNRSIPAAATDRTLRSRICSPARRTNCFGISAPKRLPSPPARRIAWIRISRACLGLALG